MGSILMHNEANPENILSWSVLHSPNVMNIFINHCCGVFQLKLPNGYKAVIELSQSTRESVAE